MGVSNGDAKPDEKSSPSTFFERESARGTKLIVMDSVGVGKRININESRAIGTHGHGGYTAISPIHHMAPWLLNFLPMQDGGDPWSGKSSRN